MVQLLSAVMVCSFKKYVPNFLDHFKRVYTKVSFRLLYHCSCEISTSLTLKFLLSATELSHIISAYEFICHKLSFLAVPQGPGRQLSEVLSHRLY